MHPAAPLTYALEQVFLKGSFMTWSDHLAKRSSRMKPSTIREILKLTQRSEVISFAGGLPAPGLFPVEALKAATQKVLGEQGSAALQYSTTEGYAPLREWVAEAHRTVPEAVQVVSGSQQGLDLVAKVLLDPGDKVVVTAPTYMGALRAFDAYEPHYLTVGVDEQGMLPDELEAALKEGPKLIYAIANFDNPTGITLSLERRHKLAELARAYDVPVYEDDPYGELRFTGEALPTLYSLAPERVIYGGTFSKIMVPGFRLGWLVAAPELLMVVARAKQAADLHTATFTQMVAHEVIKNGFMAGQIKRVRDYYRGQRDAMLKALSAHFPAEVSWTEPQGGMFLWVTLPGGHDATELLNEAVKRGVAYVPGGPFFAGGGGENTLRLSYSIATAEEIDKGMASLGSVLHEALQSAELV